MWGGRVRRFNDGTWHGAVVLNMSMSGALLELTCRVNVGDWLVVEIESPNGARGITLYTRCALVVRNRQAPSTVVAVSFAPMRAPSVPQR
jgi:hypothetical protein